MTENFIRFFDKTGSNMNLAPVDNSIMSLYDGSTINYESFSGKIFFPLVSTNLIESQNLYLLQEVTGPNKFELRKIAGQVNLVGGNPTITGLNSDFTALSIGDAIKIIDTDYTITGISGATSMQITPTPSVSVTTTDIYYYDYLSYNQLRSAPDTFAERLTVKIPELSVMTTQKFVETPFFVYDVNYTEDAPFIEKSQSSNYTLVDGSSDTIDSLTGRVQLSQIETIPTQINIGIASSQEYIYERKLLINNEKEYRETLAQAPDYTGDYYTFHVGGTSHPFYDISQVYLQGGTGSSEEFYSVILNVISVGITGSDTYVRVEKIDSPVTSSNFSGYRLKWINDTLLAEIDLYGEVEGEDERLKIVLQNFGKKIDYDKEYIFRDSDIKEDLPDYKLLNKKRKELLLEGDNIYPYLGSYKALINIINYFGYFDVKIKEYFLNVDEDSSNYGNYMQILVPKNAKQREEVRAAWRVVPSKIYKKTSLFGLFYDLNKATENEDIYGIPEVVDAFDFSPEEVLIKLFGLKELLKKEYLPLNARIYDITGEGIYFERIRIDSWADNLHHLVIDIGKRPEFNIYPPIEGYVSDLRRMDAFYIEKFVEQGLTGFLGASAFDPSVTAAGYTGPVSSLYSTFLDSYDNYLDNIYDSKGNLLPPVDSSWQYMPPSVYDLNFNQVAARLQPLPDDKNIIAGAPILLESIFDLSWQEAYFNWSQLAILGPSGSPLNINIWTWDSIGKGEYIDMRWTIEKHGDNGFYYDSERRPIDSFIVSTQGAAAFSIPGKITVDVLNGSIVNVNIAAGYGYTSAPSVFIPGPGIYTSPIGATSSGTTIYVLNTFGLGIGMTPTVTTGTGVFVPGTIVTSISTNSFTVDTAPSTPLSGATIYASGTTASITLTVNEGYISGATWSGGAGYNYGPTVKVDSPPVTYEVTNKILHSVALPYEGEYDVALYNYDITNNYTVEFQKYYVKSKQAEFISISKKETLERRWEEFKHVSWNELTGPWYYPIHVDTKWEDAKVSWDKLDFESYKDQSLYDFTLDTEIYSIDRDNPTLVLTGNLSGNLPNSLTLDIGDYIFLTREDSDPLVENLKIPADSIDSTLEGLVGLTAASVLLTGASGSTLLSTVPYDTTNYLSVNDSIWVNNFWYKVESVGATSITIVTPLINSFLSSPVLKLSSTLYVTANYVSASVEMRRYSRVLLSDNCYYNSLDPNSDFYDYVNGLTSTGSTITFTENETILKRLILENSSLSGNKELHATWGIFTGTYALEITNISTNSGNTQLRLSDPNKELYYLDGNFTANLSDYDVDYAETRIGVQSLNYENLSELTWNDNPTLTWFGTEYHGGTLCGFVIPFVLPGGSITVDEEPSFFFSGDSNIDSTKNGLQVASLELIASENTGINKYYYDVLPDDELYIIDSSSSNLDFSISRPVGATSASLTGVPGGGSLKIPAEIAVTITGGSITAVTIINPGYGYEVTPAVTISPVGCTGTPGSISLIMSGLPYAGTVIGATFSAGSGYSSVPAVEVEAPTGYREADNYIWTGSEWIEVIRVTGSTLLFGSSLTSTINAGDFPLLPYNYHKQLYLKPALMQQFYYFIQGKAKNPSNEMLSYINLDNGVQSEWLIYPDRTYTYPLRNSILNSSIPQYSELSEDYLYNKWVAEGSDYPPLNVYSDYTSNRLSFESRIPYSVTLQSPYSFIDTVISDQQHDVLQFTPIVFNFDNCTIPGKNSPRWTVKDDDSGKIQVISEEESLMWNFTKPGRYSVSLEIKDSNGNKSSVNKTSFVVVKEFELNANN